MKTIKKLSAIILAVVLLFGSVPMAEMGLGNLFTTEAHALNLRADDKLYGDFVYGYTDGYENEIIIKKYVGLEKHVTVPAFIEDLPVTELMQYSFSPEESVNFYFNSECEYIESVVLPDSVEIIGTGAFEGCKKLTKVVMSKELDSIYEKAFKNCSSLKELDLSYGANFIAEDAFYGTQIKDLVISSETKHFSAGSYFLRGSLVESLTIKSEYIYLHTVCFVSDTLKTVAIDGTVEDICDDVFGDVETAVLPERIDMLNSFPNDVYYVFEKVYGYCGEVSEEDYNWVTFKESEREILKDVNFRYYLNKNGEAVTFRYTGTGTENIVVPSTLGGVPVVEIGRETFWGDDIKSVVLPDTVTHIHSEVFAEQEELESVTFGSGLQSIGYGAFYNCPKLKAISLPERITTIPGYAFYDCSSLESFHAKGVTSVLVAAFGRAGIIEDLELSEDFYYIGAGAFEACLIQSFKYDRNVTHLGRWAFNLSDIRFFEFNDALAEIGERSFSNTPLKNVILPSNLKTIGEEAFENCYNFSEIIIPDTVTTIGNDAFRDCKNLDGELTISENVTKLGTGAYSHTGYTVLNYNSPSPYAQTAFFGTKIATVNFGSSVRSIPAHLFDSCKEIKTITLPNTVTKIGASAFEDCENLESITISSNISYIGENAFKGCTKLTELTIPKSVTKLNPNVFSENIKTVYYNAENCVFEGLTKYPTDVGTYYSPFYNTNIENVVLGDTVKRIPDYFFRGINFIGDIVLPDSVTEIGKMAFAGSSIQSIEFSSNLIVIEDRAFKSTKVKLVENVFPDELRMIGKEAFAYCRELEEIYIPDSVVDIAESAFEGSMNLKKVRMSSNVRLISSEAFRDCRSLYEFKWDSDIKLISENAFFNCKVLADFDFTGVELLYPNSFSYTGVTVVALGENKKEEATNLVSVETQSFKDCENLETVSIGGNVTTIKSEAFASCANLETAVISDSVVNIATDAFYGCDALTIYCMEDSYAHTYAVNNDIPVSTFVVAPIPNQTYTGSKIEPDVDVSVSGKELVEKTDFAVKYSDNINVGTAKVIVNGKGIYKVLSSIANFTIITKSIAPVTFSEISEQNYTGEAVTPSLTVTDGSNILKEGKDYTVEYKNNVNAGTATATIRGIGNYHGTASVNFEITELSVSQKIINAITDFFSSFFAKILAFFNSIFG